MQLSDEAIKEFQEIWKQEFGEDITPAYARQRGTPLVELLTLILKQKHKEKTGSSPSPGSPGPLNTGESG